MNLLKRTHLARILVSALALVCLTAVAGFAGVQTEVVINKSLLLNLNKSAERVSIANPAIADVMVVTPRQIQINGLAVGETSLIVWEKGVEKRTFFELAVINQPRGEVPAQVLLQVKVAQVDKSSMKKLGISAVIKGSTAEGFLNLIGTPKGGIAGNVNALEKFDPLDKTIFQAGVSHYPSGVGAVLQALAENGHAKILAEPNLLVKSGQKGNFLAGSRIPYTIVQTSGGTSTTTIEYINVGVKLNFAPLVMPDGMIFLKIDPAEVSSIAGKMEVNGYPIIDTREVRTEVELKEGESLVLAGLLQEEHIRNMSKIPLLGDIPILGALFRSTENELREKELLFFITPKLIKPVAPGAKVDLPTDKQLTPEQERELRWIP